LNLPEKYQVRADSSIKIADFDFDGFPDLVGIFSIGSLRKASILLGNG